MMKQKRLLLNGLVLLIAVIMIGTGLLRIYRVYQNYRADILSNESRHLGSIVGTSAGGIDWMLQGYSRQLSMLTERMEFAAAEEEYARSRDPSVMKDLMARRDIQRLDMRYCMAAWENSTLLGATITSYPPANADEETLGGLCHLREDEDGNFWFVFDKTAEIGIRYELAVRVETIFSYQAENARIGRTGYFFLMDKERRFVAYSGNMDSGIIDLDTLATQYTEFDMNDLGRIVDNHRGDYLVFRFPWDDTGGESLVVTAPVNMSDDTLISGAALSFTEFNTFLSDTLKEVTWIVLLEIGGALILVMIASGVMIAKQRSDLELSVVRERADLMEEINRQQQSLYHTERLQQLGIMTSGIVHEFNNMLTPMMSQSMLLLEELADRDETPEFEYALDIFEASEKAREILRRTSMMGRKDTGAGYEVVDLGSVLQKTLNLSSMAKDPHILQKLELPDEPLLVYGNEQLLTQSFLNLCINACQAMHDEGILAVSLSKTSVSGAPYAVVRISDTGPGISEEDLPYIFDPFYSTKGEKGTGLGLAICKKIIETHKGTITAENLEKGGAVFIVQIPAAECRTATKEDDTAINGEMTNEA